MNESAKCINLFKVHPALLCVVLSKITYHHCVCVLFLNNEVKLNVLLKKTYYLKTFTQREDNTFYYVVDAQMYTGKHFLSKFKFEFYQNSR